MKSLAELAEALVVPRPEPQLRLISLEDGASSARLQDAAAALSLKAAAGYFGNGEAVEPEGWVEADGVGKLDERDVRCPGRRSVNGAGHPRRRPLVFRANPAGTAGKDCPRSVPWSG